MSNDAIGERFKAYEQCFDFTLPHRMPMVIRVDGRAFHSLPLLKPFDNSFHAQMSMTTKALCKEVQGAVLGYFQSDEISIIARDDLTNTTQPWVGKRLSKLLSLSAATATAAFNQPGVFGPCQFDSRVFILPDLNEVTNYLIWRQQDATRNSISMAARAVFSHKALHGKNTSDMLDMLRDAGQPWEEILPHYRRGTVCYPATVDKYVEKTGQMCARREWQYDLEPPVFTQDRGYIAELYQLPETTKEKTDK